MSNHHFPHRDIIQFFDPILLPDGTRTGSMEVLLAHLLAVGKMLPVTRSGIGITMYFYPIIFVFQSHDEPRQPRHPPPLRPFYTYCYSSSVCFTPSLSCIHCIIPNQTCSAILQCSFSFFQMSVSLRQIIYLIFLFLLSFPFFTSIYFLFLSLQR